MKQATIITMPDVFPVTCHTRYVGKGSVFVAIRGAQQDGVHYIIDAIYKGATEIVVADDVVFSPEISQAK